MPSYEGTSFVLLAVEGGFEPPRSS